MSRTNTHGSTPPTDRVTPSALEQIGQGQDVIRVLLIEDNSDHRDLVGALLREAASDAVLASCDRLSAALEPVRGGLADLVLLDLSLPDSDGLHGLRQLRTIAPEVPVVILTNNTDANIVRDAVTAGAQDYLIKGKVDSVSLTQAMHYAVERQRTHRRLTELALRDALTGLPNRVLFADRLDHALANLERRTDDELAVMFVDLDDFKAINDTHGHSAGDVVLIEAARRLTNHLRSADTAARIGGDEFVVLCENVADVKAALTLAQRITDALAEPYRLATDHVAITAATGVAIAHVGEDSGSLLQRADTAMYAAKRGGPGRIAAAAART